MHWYLLGIVDPSKPKDIRKRLSLYQEKVNVRKNLILYTALSALFFTACCVALTFAEEKEDAKTEQTASDDSQKETATIEPQSSDSETEAEKPKTEVEEAKKPLVIDGLALTDAERQVLDLTNVERKRRGLPALRVDRRLMESARRQANWMARTGAFRHGNSGYAENIAMGQRSSRDVVVAWMNSSGHFRNMMSRGHGAIGIGAYRGKNGAMYWCQQFSR